MTKSTIWVTAVVIGALSVACMAQQEEDGQDAPIAYTYATYYYCKPSGQDRRDEIFKETEAPVYNALMKDGAISSWGWLAHHTGGQWRRVFYFQNETLNGLLDAQTTMQAKFDAMDDETDADSDLCTGHDDYIWTVESTSQEPGEGRADAGLSVYYVCNESKEERADELFESVYVPLLKKAVTDGKLSSWGWSAHFIGGQYRRLQTMTAADHKAVLAARANILDALYDDDKPDAGAAEFSEICGSHTDYLWNIQMEMP